MIEKKILIIDDERMILDLLERVFTKAGYIVRSAETAEIAMKILKEESIMVILSDLNLPGMSGIDFCQRLKKDNPIGIYYALTGYADLFGLIECRKAGFEDFFTKPVQMKALLEAVQYAFNKLERWQVSEYDLA